MKNYIEEKYIDNSVNSLSIEGMENILYQMKNCICKIVKNDGSKGTGFFCKIPFPNEYNLLPVLITNNHVLGQNDLGYHNIIEITIDNEKREKNIKINSKRLVYTNENLDFTFIEIQPNKDNIFNFLEIDEIINKEETFTEKSFKKKSIYTLHYPKGKDVEVSYGQIKDLMGEDIRHLCITDKGSSGSPILSLDSFKVIGIHKGNGLHFDFNLATFIKYAINVFHKVFKNEFNKKNFNKDKIKNEMTINYSIGDYNYIRIFSKKFVKNNKKNCKIIINGEKESELCEYIDKDLLKSKTNILEIKLREIKSITDMSYMFLECRRLLFIPDISNWDTSKVTDMSYMFGSCLSLSSLPEKLNWNTSNVKSMKGMFELCIELPNLPDISNWDTSNVIDMKLMFNKCSSLVKLPDISQWDISNVKDIKGMFNECRSLKSLPDISKWNIGSVTNMSYMFNKCSSLKSLPDISIWNTFNVTNMSFMFNECSSLKFIPDISIWNINNEANTTNMFDNCKKLSNIPQKFINY